MNARQTQRLARAATQVAKTKAAYEEALAERREAILDVFDTATYEEIALVAEVSKQAIWATVRAQTTA